VEAANPLHGEVQRLADLGRHPIARGLDPDGATATLQKSLGKAALTLPAPA